MIQLTKELRALRNTSEIVLGSPRDIQVNAEDIFLLETVKYSWGMGTHVMIRAGGNPMTFVVSETVEEIREKMKFDSF